MLGSVKRKSEKERKEGTWDVGDNFTFGNVFIFKSVIQKLRTINANYKTKNQFQSIVGMCSLNRISDSGYSTPSR